MNNLVKDFKEKRIMYINEWPSCQVFEAENVYLSRYEDSAIQFKSYQFKVFDDKNYNIVISNIMDALDNMPRRPDIAFEFYWKALDNILYTISGSGKNSKEQLQDLIRYLFTLVSKSDDIYKLFIDYFAVLPEKSAKYLYRNIFQGYDLNREFSFQEKSVKQLILRLIDYEPASKEKIVAIINYIASKYGYDPSTNFQELRNGWRFLYKLLIGETLTLKENITFNNQSVNIISLTVEERLNFFINGILYTFRNDRFHGNIISPFRTSKTTFETYSHPTYCLILVDYILLLLLQKSSFTETRQLLKHSLNNLEYYKQMFV
ncbi:TPA: hypothetical protein ACGO3H_002109 [Streptococcus suis]